MSEIIALSNQKGGVGKTTAALNLGVGLKRKGYSVLFIDMDAQCNLSYVLDGNMKGLTAYDLLFNGANAKDAIQHVEEADLIAGNPNLIHADAELQGGKNVLILRESLKSVEKMYDYIIIDSPPTLGLITLNIFSAANSIIIPALADIFSLQGIGQLYTTISAVKSKYNPYLNIKGIFLTKFSSRCVLNRELKEMLEDTARQMNTKIFENVIRETVLIREAQASKSSIYAYAPKSKVAQDYEDFVNEFIGQ